MEQSRPQNAPEPQGPNHPNANPDALATSHPATSEGALPQAVRFASVNQEIEPAPSLQSATDTAEASFTKPPLNPHTEEELKKLSLNLKNSHIHNSQIQQMQQQRMSNFAFEPVSLPVSRVPSNDSSQYQTSREHTRSGGPSPWMSPHVSAITTPPLTPAGTCYKENQPSGVVGAGLAKPPKADPDVMGLKFEGPGVRESQGTPTEGMASSAPTSGPSSHEEVSTRPTLMSRESSGVDSHPKQTSGFAIGPSQSSESSARSRESSPKRRGGSGTITPPAVSRPFTPIGDRDDPYARNKRPPQSRNLDAIDARFVFGSKDSRRRSGIGLASSSAAASTAALPRSGSGSDPKIEHRNSTFSLPSLGGKKEYIGHSDEKPHGSMSELKRFFFHHKSKRSQSPSADAKGSANSSGTKTPPNPVANNVPFADDHGIETKWGKFGKALGSGAGGSVKLIKRSGDGKTFAVKQFRDKHSYESDREYNKKVTAEFCIGSTLHHGNIIETLDIIHEKGHWYEVMEYAPYDLFAIVMTGKMSREEVACAFLQIVNGVAYLHSMGLAHRDLKLDNVVVNKHGIMKIIDFGSASVFRYPFENDIILASGVVGSDPYLAPEVYDHNKYDPQAADIWSLAVIYNCMLLRRFPWKAPRMTDNSFKLFTDPPTSGTPATGAAPKEREKSAMDISSEAPADRRASAPAHVAHNSHHVGETKADEPGTSTSPGPRVDAKPQEIRGPWRLLRLLPRETRIIIGRMLEIHPNNRATLNELLTDSWVVKTPVCQQLEDGTIYKAPGHEHVLTEGKPAG